MICMSIYRGKALITGVETLVASEYWLQNGWSIPTQVQYTFTHAEFTENFYSGQLGLLPRVIGYPMLQPIKRACQLELKQRVFP